MKKNVVNIFIAPTTVTADVAFIAVHMPEYIIRK
jgi:hypothetical protein